MDSPIANYLAELRQALRHDPLLARRVVEEAADHLQEIVAEERRNGMSQHEAEEAAVRRFGPAGPLAAQFGGFSLPLKIMVGLSSVMTIAVALWLFSVIALVLPSRDPSRIPFWSGIAIGFLVYSGLCLTYLIVGPRQAALRLVVLALSVAAILFGAYCVLQMVSAASSGRHFEGYLLLLGLIIAAHGIIALVYAAVSVAIARQIAAR
ncbi:MAG TPA: permease prefix domain 1-containing protein [Candidatus Binatia bacterium]|nr:permease prefix domain 1-containing protein [Candidatus Binatia bacterium]